MVVEPSHTEEESASNIPTNKSCGRLKGKTMIYLQNLKERIRLATKEAATKYADVREQAMLANKRAEQDYQICCRCKANVWNHRCQHQHKHS
jgi:hypothetical protein